MTNRKLAWTDEAWKDYIYWQSQDKKTLKRINKLIKETKNLPFEGIGKPEPLKENLSGFWSRRIPLPSPLSPPNPPSKGGGQRNKYLFVRGRPEE
jgi:toxin YoeB